MLVSTSDSRKVFRWIPKHIFSEYPRTSSTTPIRPLDADHSITYVIGMLDVVGTLNIMDIRGSLLSVCSPQVGKCISFWRFVLQVSGLPSSPLAFIPLPPPTPLLQTTKDPNPQLSTTTPAVTGFSSFFIRWPRRATSALTPMCSRSSRMSKIIHTPPASLHCTLLCSSQ